MTNTDAFSIAKRRAKSRPQIVWKDKSGAFVVAARSAKNIKRALLAVGTQGRFTEITSPRMFFTHTWGIGILMIRNARWGF